MGLIVPIWKRKGDGHDAGKFRGITLLSQVLKLLERVLEARIMIGVECDFGEAQQGSSKGRGTTDGMYALRQMVEKRQEVQGSMALGFVDLEKAFDTVPSEVVIAMLRWMGVPETEVRMVEGTYEKTTATVVVGEGASEEFDVKICLREGSVLNPLLFIAVLDLTSRKTVTKDAMTKLLYADDLALVANGKQELQEALDECNGLFTRHGLNINLQKTEVLHIGRQREELDIELEGKKLTQWDSFVYLGGAVCGDWKTEREVRRRAQAGENVWRAVEGVMADRRISKRLTVKVMRTCVTPACLYGTETLAMIELQQQRLQVWENNSVQQIAGVTRAEWRIMVELREEIGVQRSLTEKLVRSRLLWAGHIERMADDRLPKRAAELCEQGRRRRGRPRLRWEDCVKRCDPGRRRRGRPRLI